MNILLQKQHNSLPSIKNFTHNFMPRVELPRVVVDGTRFYQTSQGLLLPSVTTILSSDEEKKEGIDAWKKRVGDEEAARVSRVSTGKGTKTHALCESYLKNELTSLEGVFPLEKHAFLQIKKIIDEYIDDIRGLELPLYSNFLQCAGTADCIARYRNTLSLVDFKTSARVKKKEYIRSYFMQGAAYCVMFEELYNIPISQIVLIFGNEESLPQIFVEKRDNYIHDFISLREKYRSQKGI